jgi:hypothetical protein
LFWERKKKHQRMISATVGWIDLIFNLKPDRLINKTILLTYIIEDSIIISKKFSKGYSKWKTDLEQPFLVKRICCVHSPHSPHSPGTPFILSDIVTFLMITNFQILWRVIMGMFGKVIGQSDGFNNKMYRSLQPVFVFSFYSSFNLN